MLQKRVGRERGVFVNKLRHVASCTVPVKVNVEVFFYFTKGFLFNAFHILTHVAIWYKSINLRTQET